MHNSSDNNLIKGETNINDTSNSIEIKKFKRHFNSMLIEK